MKIQPHPVSLRVYGITCVVFCLSLSRTPGDSILLENKTYYVQYFRVILCVPSYSVASVFESASSPPPPLPSPPPPYSAFPSSPFPTHHSVSLPPPCTSWHFHLINTSLVSNLGTSAWESEDWQAGGGDDGDGLWLWLWWRWSVCVRVSACAWRMGGMKRENGEGWREAKSRDEVT